MSPFDKDFLDWFYKTYKDGHHHQWCELVAYGQCTCSMWAYQDWIKE